MFRRMARAAFPLPRPYRVSDHIEQLRLAAVTRPLTPDQDLVLPGEIYATWDYALRDTLTGKLLLQAPPRKAESFLANFMYILQMEMNGSQSQQNIVAQDGVGYVCQRDRYALRSDGASGDATLGIAVGTGVTAPVIGNYTIQTLIAHGTGTGQLQYGAMTYGAPASDAATSQCTLTRNFANASGGSITVQEIGAYVLVTAFWSTSSQKKVLILRDTTGGIAVANGITLTINYRPQGSV